MVDVNSIALSTENLHITSDKQLHKHQCSSDVDSYLVGDEFSKSWDLNKLNLPPKPSASIGYKVVNEEGSSLSLDQVYANGPLSCSDTIPAHFKHLKCLTKGNSKTVYQATFSVKTETGLNFRPGDSISIFPENNSQTVSWLLGRLTLDNLQDADTPFILESVSTQARNVPTWLIPGRSTSLRFLLTYCCELYIPITRRILRLLADHCIDDSTNSISAERQRNRLLEFCSQEGKKMFEMYIQKPELNLLDILYIFSSCRLPFIRLLEILPRLQPRSYTLINLVDEPLSQEQDLIFIFTRVDFLENMVVNSNSHDNASSIICRYPHRYHGTCTGWLERIWFGINQPDDYFKNTFVNLKTPTIHVYLRQNLTQFNLPADINQPIIMIGAGSGIAPFISFIRQRKRDYLKTQASAGNLWLIYGCRSPTSSLLFKEELSDALNTKVLSHLCLCFSRAAINSPNDKYTLDEISTELVEQACFPIKSHYVQECIFHEYSIDNKPSEHDIQLMNFVYEKNAKIMICGEAYGLATGVFQSWIKLIAMRIQYTQTKIWCTYSELSVEELKHAEEYLQQMRKSKYYQEDIWR
ncbi:unnamed protein product [Heterobilharzia americana]|nr:unnamed protein product [Heterobilharzia americana]CAH8514075.1 unnamed protein product [Heterobilharzia americana]